MLVAESAETTHLRALLQRVAHQDVAVHCRCHILGPQLVWLIHLEGFLAIGRKRMHNKKGLCAHAMYLYGAP